MLTLSAETHSCKTVKAISSYCVPNYYGYKTTPASVARRLSKHSVDLTYTQVCRNIKTIAAAKKALSAAAKIKNITTILAVTGDKASSSDISVFDLIRSIDKKRFKVAAAIVFTRRNEANRIARKAAAGAAILYTQPVFPGNSSRLLAAIRQLRLKTPCRIKIGAFIPFSSAACQKIINEKPHFMTDLTIVKRLREAELKGPKAAYRETVKIARENVNAAIETAEMINSFGRTSCRAIGIHLYGLTDRIFWEGRRHLRATAANLLENVLNQPKKAREQPKKHSFNKRG